MDGDKNFIAKVKKDQGILLEKFTYEYCRSKWNENLDYIYLQIEKARERRKITF